jgi:hypothetical protein
MICRGEPPHDPLSAAQPSHDGFPQRARAVPDFARFLRLSGAGQILSGRPPPTARSRPPLAAQPDHVGGRVIPYFTTPRWRRPVPADGARGPNPRTTGGGTTLRGTGHPFYRRRRAARDSRPWYNGAQDNRLNRRPGTNPPHRRMVRVRVPYPAPIPCRLVLTTVARTPPGRTLRPPPSTRGGPGVPESRLASTS